MKNQICTIAFAIGLSAAFGSTPMMAQTSEHGTIPFRFQAGAAKLAAGTYAVTWAHGSPVISMRNEETGHTIQVQAPVGKHGVLGQAKLVFRQYGSRYFLAEVWFPDHEVGHTLPPTKYEKETAVAVNQTRPEVVYIAMR